MRWLLGEGFACWDGRWGCSGAVLVAQDCLAEVHKLLIVKQLDFDIHRTRGHAYSEVHVTNLDVETLR